MKPQKTKDNINFYQIFNKTQEEKSVKKIAGSYLCDVKGIDRSILYNELIPRKLIGYCPERKALAFPLMRGFLKKGSNLLLTVIL